MENPRLRSNERQAAAHAAQRSAVAEPAEAPRFTPSPRVAKKNKRWSKWVVVLAVLALLVLGGLCYWLFGNKGGTAGLIDTNKYQAVFFTNGQVYFGKLKTVGKDHMVLKDVFYIQASQNSSENPQQTQNKDSNNNMQLVKLGNEVHGPDNEMVINNDQVLFFENLKKDGKVTKGIDEYNKTKQN